MENPDQNRYLSLPIASGNVRSESHIAQSSDKQNLSFKQTDTSASSSLSYLSVKNEEMPNDPRYYGSNHTFSKLENLNNSLKSGGYVCYKYTMVILAFLSTCGLIASVFNISTQIEIYLVPHYVYIVLNGWQAYQLFVAFQAVHRKDLLKAERAVTLIKWYMIIFAVINIGFLLMIRYNEISFAGLKEVFAIETDSLHGIVMLFIILIIVLELVAYAIILYGALKVRDLLNEIWDLTNGESLIDTV